jgi:hypothetical protein
MSRNPFSFKIDYDVAIAQDEADIAICQDGGPAERLAAFWAELPKDPSWGDWTPVTGYDVLQAAVASGPEMIEKCISIISALSRKVLIGMLAAENRMHESNVPETTKTYIDEEMKKFGVNWWAFEKDIRKGFDYLTVVRIVSAEQRREALKKAKASRSRHARNKAKHGGA